MTKMDYLELLVDEIHSTTVATIGSDGHPQTRIIDMMYYDEEGVYFLTATGKTFYDQLMEQQYVAISATKDKIAVSLRGKIKNIGKKNLDIMFEKNPYMKTIYPGDTKDAIEVFRLYEAQGEYFDISNPSNIVRDTITIGKTEAVQIGYFIGKECIGCKLCSLYVRKNALIYLQFRLLSTRIIVCIAEDVQKFVRSSVLRKEVHYDF